MKLWVYLSKRKKHFSSIYDDCKAKKDWDGTIKARLQLWGLSELDTNSCHKRFEQKYSNRVNRILNAPLKRRLNG